MKLARPDLAAYVVVGLCLLGIVVLAALRVPVPDFLTYAATTALGIGGGVAVQAAGAGTPAVEPTPAAGPVSLADLAAAPLPPVPALVAEPQTGVFRAATHAP